MIMGGYLPATRQMCVCLPSRRTLRLCKSLGALLIDIFGSLGASCSVRLSAEFRTRKHRLSPIKLHPRTVSPVLRPVSMRTSVLCARAGSVVPVVSASRTHLAQSQASTHAIGHPAIAACSGSIRWQSSASFNTWNADACKKSQLSPMRSSVFMTQSNTFCDGTLARNPSVP